MLYNGSYYGAYDSPKLTDIYPDVDTFLADYNSVGIPTTITQQNATTLYYMLYAKYANSHIAGSDRTRWKYDLFSIVFSYGPTWEVRLKIQNKLINLTEEEILQGSKAIYNVASAPGNVPSTAALEEIQGIDSQNTTNYKRDKMTAYLNWYESIRTEVTERFIAVFRRLFQQILQPQRPLWYETPITEDNEDDN